VRSLDPTQAKQVMELRHIDQVFRKYDVSTRIGEPVVQDAGVLPDLEFRISRPNGRATMPHVIGVPQMSAFDANGEASVRLHLPQGRVEDIRIAVTHINRDRVELMSTTHKWRFGMALSVLPDEVLYPGLLEQATGFDEGDIRLNMVGMLMDAGRVRPAAALLDNVAADFPDLAPQVRKSRDLLRQRTARLILEELQRHVAAGQPAKAAASARLFPDRDLTPQVRVSIRNMIDDYEMKKRRVDEAAAILRQLIGQFEDDQQRQQAREMISSLLSDLDIHNIDRLTTWELLAEDETLLVESSLALAVSGWMLGADDAVQGFAECHGLFQIRRSVADFVALDESDEITRSGLARRMQTMEGFTVDRVASIIRHMPPPFALTPQPAEDGTLRFHLSSADGSLRCVGIVPSDYSTSRRYPLLIAVPRQGVSLQNTLQWWSRQANRYGFIVAVPEVLPQNTEQYAADSGTHARLLNLIRQLKLRLQVDDNRVFIGGHGVGGDVAMDFASTHPELFAGVVSVAGLGRRHLSTCAHNSVDLSWYIVIGERQNGWYQRMRILLSRLFRRVAAVRRYCNVILVRYPDRGFESFREELPSIFEWMNSTVRDPWPSTIACRVMRSTDLSWHWIRLDSLPDRFQTLEQPTTATDTVARYAPLEASLSRNNGIRISTAPAGGFLLLAPEMPGIDPARKIAIRGKGTDERIEFHPSVRDLLDEYAKTGERNRLIHMKVQFGR